MKKKLVFFLRNYNDIDHITPIIFEILSKEDKIQADIVLMERNKSDIKYTYLDDYRIEALNEFQHCTIHIIEDIGTANVKEKINSKKENIFKPKLKSFGRKLPTAIPERLWNKIIEDSTSQSDYWNSRADLVYNELIEDHKNVIIAFDWIFTSGGKGDFVEKVVDRANSDGHTTVSLPHGDMPFYNFWYKNDNPVHSRPEFGDVRTPINEFTRPNEIEINYDYIVYPNEHNINVKIQKSDAERNADTLKVLGSPRFNEKWISILTGLAPEFTPEVDENECRVVLFTRKSQYTVDQKALAGAIRILSAFPSITLVVKHHTRSFNDDFYNEFKKQFGKGMDEMPNIQVVEDDIHSVSLLDWGDVFVDVGVSIINEAIVRNKVIFSLEYPHWNETTVSQYMNECTIRSRDELYTKAQKLAKGEDLETYNQEERQAFISDMIYPEGDQVLQIYREFLLNK